MKKLASYTFEDADLKSYLQEDFLAIHIKQNAFEIVTDLSESSHLFDLLELVEGDEKVKGVFIFNTPGIFGEEEYDAFLRKVFGLKADDPFSKIAAYDKQGVRKRQINILNHFITSTLATSKLIVLGLQGCVVTPFFGASLAADLRFGSPDMGFCLAHVKYGLPPTGALPYFLPRFLGLNHAKDLLFRGGKISAQQALELRLINQIVPGGNFVQECLEILRGMTHADAKFIRITKQLTNTYARELENYLEFESRILFF